MARPKDCTTDKELQIALTLSGGGYRASVFHIGVLSYLYHLKMDDGSRMLDHVTVMSTVSGGTITGVDYLLSLSKEGNVNEHLAELFIRIKSNNLADKLLDRISRNRKNPTLSIIKELGNVYDEVFFEGKSQNFNEIQRIVQKSAIHHFAAYATDITNALPFRFQAVKDCYKKVVIGNTNWEIKKERAGIIRIADIVAASSCFPIVFEPINYPRDFFVLEESDEKAQTNMQIQLMDGGIIDNQGVDYLFEANRQMVDGGDENGTGIDFAIISDAAASVDDSLETATETSCRNTRRSIKTFLPGVKLPCLKAKLSELRRNASVNNVLCVISLVAVMMGASGWLLRDYICIRVTFVSLSLCFLMLALLIILAKCCMPSAVKKSNQYRIPKGLAWKISFLQYYRQLYKRYVSFSKVVSTVMMGHIRRRNLKMIELNTRWKNRVIVPCVSVLSSNGDWKQDEMSSKLMTKASKLMGYSDRASNFHSTLWFSDADIENGIPEKILVCGQFSICYELYLWSKTHKGSQANMTKVVRQLISDSMRERLKEDWKKFKESPEWMVDLKNIS